jgi:uncharacterized protein (DUF433 family)
VSTQIERLTPPEAAMVASVTVREVHRAIDEKILPERYYTLEGGRHLHVVACPLVGFYFHAAKALTAEERGLIIRRLAERMDTPPAAEPIPRTPADWTVQDGFLTVSLWEFAIGAEDRHARLTEARALVVEDPDILSGTPVIRGTRIPVYDVAASVASGLPRERIRAAWSGLDDRMIDLASVYADTTPPRGRPRQSGAFRSDAAIISARKVARRHAA